MPLTYFDFTSPANDVHGLTDMGPFGQDTGDGPVRMNRVQQALVQIKQYVGPQPEGVNGYTRMQDRFQAYSRSAVVVAPHNADIRWLEVADVVLPGVTAGGNAAALTSALTLASGWGGGTVLIAPGGEAPDFATSIAVPTNVRLTLSAGQTMHLRAGSVLNTGAFLQLEQEALLYGYGAQPVIDLVGNGCGVVGSGAVGVGTTGDQILRNDTNDFPLIRIQGTGTGLLHRFGNVIRNVGLANNSRNAPVIAIDQASYTELALLSLSHSIGGGIVASEWDNSNIDDCLYGDVSSRGQSFPSNVVACIDLNGGPNAETCNTLTFTRQRFTDYHDIAIMSTIGAGTQRNHTIRFNDYRISNAQVHASPAVYMANTDYVVMRDGRMVSSAWAAGANTAQDLMYLQTCRGVTLDSITVRGNGTQRTLNAGVRLDGCDSYKIDGIWGEASAQNAPTSAFVVYQSNNTNGEEGAIAVVDDQSGIAVEKVGSPTSFATEPTGLVNTNASVSGAVQLDVSKQDTFNLTLSGASGTRAISFKGWPPVPEEATVKLYIHNDGGGGKTPSWPNNVKWPGGTVPVATSSAGSTDIYVFSSPDAGVTIYGVQVQANFA